MEKERELYHIQDVGDAGHGDRDGVGRELDTAHVHGLTARQREDPVILGVVNGSGRVQGGVHGASSIDVKDHLVSLSRRSRGGDKGSDAEKRRCRWVLVDHKAAKTRKRERKNNNHRISCLGLLTEKTTSKNRELVFGKHKSQRKERAAHAPPSIRMTYSL